VDCIHGARVIRVVLQGLACGEVVELWSFFKALLGGGGGEDEEGILKCEEEEEEEGK